MTQDDGARSRREVLSLGGAVAAGAALGGAMMSATPALAQVAGLRVALVDIGVLFKSYKRKEYLEKQINARKEQLEKQAQDQTRIIESLRKQLDTIKEGSEVWRTKRKELKLAVKQFEVTREGMEEELKLEVENLTLQILDEIEEKVREFGKTPPGYDLIIKIDTKGWGDEKFQERIFRAQVSSILYYDPKLDVTPTIVAALNDPKWIEQVEKRAGTPASGGTNGGGNGKK